MRSVVLPHAGTFAILVSWGEVLIGLALVLGLATRFAAAAAFLLVLNYMFAKGAWFWTPSSNDAADAAIALALLIGAAGRTCGSGRVSRQAVAPVSTLVAGIAAGPAPTMAAHRARLASAGANISAGPAPTRTYPLPAPSKTSPHHSPGTSPLGACPRRRRCKRTASGSAPTRTYPLRLRPRHPRPTPLGRRLRGHALAVAGAMHRCPPARTGGAGVRRQPPGVRRRGCLGGCRRAPDPPATRQSTDA